MKCIMYLIIFLIFILKISIFTNSPLGKLIRNSYSSLNSNYHTITPEYKIQNSNSQVRLYLFLGVFSRLP
jgi:hypothetical protein